MTAPAPAKITPPLAEYLKRIDQAKRDFAKGVFPDDGLVSPASNGGLGFEVRILDKTGAKTVECPTAADVNMCLNVGRDRALSDRNIARQVSNDFYQAYFDAINARRPLQVTEREARLCGVCRKLANALSWYDGMNREMDEGETISRIRSRAVTLLVDRLIQRQMICTPKWKRKPLSNEAEAAFAEITFRIAALNETGKAACFVWSPCSRQMPRQRLRTRKRRKQLRILQCSNRYPSALCFPCPHSWHYPPKAILGSLGVSVE
ncbi:hypothetical protein LP421_10540 [Rhizobium sp. RCAM05350]|nr:hypothetical protein LP421_10540 [Rhizobium sp. RCAM05350]